MFSPSGDRWKSSDLGVSVKGVTYVYIYVHIYIYICICPCGYMYEYTCIMYDV